MTLPEMVQVLQIIASRESRTRLAKQFGVSLSHVCKLKSGKHWRRIVPAEEEK